MRTGQQLAGRNSEMVIYSPGGAAGGSSTKETNRGRKAPLSGADLYCTPPWVTRAVFEHPCALGAHVHAIKSVWEPACGLGHMADVVREYCPTVYASDVGDYGFGDVVDFIESSETPKAVDLIITNPPFKLALEFALKAIDLAPRVALLCRTQWLEGQERYDRLFSEKPPQRIVVFSERVTGMHAGKWDPNAGGGVQSYSWFIWDRAARSAQLFPELFWFVPGCREKYTKPDDFARFASRRAPITVNPDEPVLPFEELSRR